MASTDNFLSTETVVADVGTTAPKTQDTIYIYHISSEWAIDCTLSNFTLIFLSLCLPEGLLVIFFQTTADLPVIHCNLIGFHAALLILLVVLRP